MTLGESIRAKREQADHATLLALIDRLERSIWRAIEELGEIATDALQTDIRKRALAVEEALRTAVCDDPSAVHHLPAIDLEKVARALETP